MLCEIFLHVQKRRNQRVLILVLMEYALRGIHYESNKGHFSVLILVLMEYALRGVKALIERHAAVVLILVLMEYALREG